MDDVKPYLKLSRLLGVAVQADEWEASWLDDFAGLPRIIDSTFVLIYFFFLKLINSKIVQYPIKRFLFQR